MNKEESAVLREIEREVLQDNPVYQRMHGVEFISTSKGRNRKRQRPICVILLQYNGDVMNKRWRSWTGEDRQDKGRIRWDEWATEVFKNDEAPSERLREEFVRLLSLCNGRF